MERKNDFSLFFSFAPSFTGVVHQKKNMLKSVGVMHNIKAAIKGAAIFCNHVARVNYHRVAQKYCWQLAATVQHYSSLKLMD